MTLFDSQTHVLLDHKLELHADEHADGARVLAACCSDATRTIDDGLAIRQRKYHAQMSLRYSKESAHDVVNIPLSMRTKDA